MFSVRVHLPLALLSLLAACQSTSMADWTSPALPAEAEPESQGRFSWNHECDISVRPMNAGVDGKHWIHFGYEPDGSDYIKLSVTGGDGATGQHQFTLGFIQPNVTPWRKAIRLTGGAAAQVIKIGPFDGDASTKLNVRIGGTDYECKEEGTHTNGVKPLVRVATPSNVTAQLIAQRNGLSVTLLVWAE